MFTALVLICAAGVKDVDECYYIASQTFYETQQECKAEIFDVYENYRELYEVFDEELGKQWKITDAKCVNWKEIQV